MELSQDPMLLFTGELAREYLEWKKTFLLPEEIAVRIEPAAPDLFPFSVGFYANNWVVQTEFEGIRHDICAQQPGNGSYRSGAIDTELWIALLQCVYHRGAGNFDMFFDKVFAEQLGALKLPVHFNVIDAVRKMTQIQFTLKPFTESPFSIGSLGYESGIPYFSFSEDVFLGILDYDPKYDVELHSRLVHPMTRRIYRKLRDKSLLHK